MTGLTEQQIKQFQRDGCIVIPGELTPQQVQAVLDQSHKLLNDFSIKDHPLTKFETGESDSHVGDQYFLDSSDKISFFFEEDAFDKEGALNKPKEKAINKIGHALHVLDPAFESISLTKRNVEIADSLGFKDPRILQSMLICKQPEIGGEVPTHQDATFLYTEPQSAIGYWYALENCTADNGALEFVPGSHKSTPVYKRMVRKPDGPGVTFDRIEGVDSYEEPTKDKFRLCECPAGSLVLIHNSVLHRSNKNLSERSRYAYTFHVIDGECKYDEKNWLQVPPSGGTNFTKLVV
jgi:phytanoyl-CoA hydroxylase